MVSVKARSFAPCPECNGATMDDPHRAEVFCVRCGLVVAENVLYEQGTLLPSEQVKERKSKTFRERVLVAAELRGACRVGRPPKELSVGELRMAVTLRLDRRMGWERIAHAINLARGLTAKGPTERHVSFHVVRDRVLEAADHKGRVAGVPVEPKLTSGGKPVAEVARRGR